MRLIDADSIIEYPSLDTVRIKEEFTNAIFRNLSENVIIENEDELMNLCKDIMELFMNVVKTAPTVENIAHWKADKFMIKSPTAENYTCSNCNFHSFDYKYCPNCGAKMIEQVGEEQGK